MAGWGRKVTDKKIVFTGSRKGTAIEQGRVLKEVLTQLKAEGYNWLIHGDCKGGDAEAHSLAQQLELKIEIYPCNIHSMRAYCIGGEIAQPPTDPLLRNHDMVDVGHVVVATPADPEVLRSGTWATVRYARKLGKQLYLIDRYGALLVENNAKE